MANLSSSAIRRNLVPILCVVLILEITLGSALWFIFRPKPVLGFLIKYGNEYLIAWKAVRDPDFNTRTYSKLSDAVAFANSELNLRISPVPMGKHEVENVWMEDRFGTYQVFWKTVDLDLLHRLTFNRRADAVFFANAFRRGDYTPSPFGHSILLKPVAAELTQ